MPQLDIRAGHGHTYLASLLWLVIGPSACILFRYSIARVSGYVVLSVYGKASTSCHQSSVSNAVSGARYSMHNPVFWRPALAMYKMWLDLHLDCWFLYPICRWFETKKRMPGYILLFSFFNTVENDKTSGRIIPPPLGMIFNDLV